MVAKGFDLHAVPYSYLDEAPKSLDSIRINIQIIYKFLNLRSPEALQELRETLIDPLKQEIYNRIDEFLDCAETVLLSLLGRIHRKTNGPFSLETAKVLFSNAKHNFSKTQQTQIENLLHDIAYIMQMKQLEYDFFSTDTPASRGATELSQIVPITGLIVGKLHRLENELKTVLEHWSQRIK